MAKLRHPGLLTGVAFCLAGFLLLPLPIFAQGRCAAGNLPRSALQGDAANDSWLTYRNPKNGLSFRYPISMRVEERDPAPFHLDPIPEVIVDLKADEKDYPNATILRFICAQGRKTPETAAGDEQTLLKTHPKGSTMLIDGHEAIVSCSCGSAACFYSVLTLQPYECQILPMVTGEGSLDDYLPPHDGGYPLLSIVKTVHFESKTK
jgi:hypothetical protein